MNERDHQHLSTRNLGSLQAGGLSTRQRALIDRLSQTPRRGPVILDGGLATELERAGHDLDGPLWSARLLAERPEAIETVHADYRDAGAEILTSASYQLSPAGAARAGLSPDDAVQLSALSVELARRSADAGQEGSSSSVPWVAASIGSYGGTLCDGSEYTGAFDGPPEGLHAHHRDRAESLLAAGPDLLLFETLPTLREAEVAARILDDLPNAIGIISMTTSTETQTAASEPLAELAALGASDAVLAVGVNCGPPLRLAQAAMHLVEQGAKSVVVYPNRGEAYEAGRGWAPDARGHAAVPWEELLRLPIAGVGGCCRTTPDDIRDLRSHVDATWVRS